MCAILGCYLEAPTTKQVEIVKRLFVESQVRGKHASGYSILQGNRIFSQIAPIPAEDFVQSYFAEVQPGDYVLQLIGHCRYSTSDLRYNQPIHHDPGWAIAHNGVVDQRDPEHWTDYGYNLQTSNDSELVYQVLLSGGEPLVRLPEASMAVCEISASKGLRWYRNAKRPLYHLKVDNGYFVCSTKDIAKRAGLENPRRCVPGTIYTPHSSQKLLDIDDLIP